MGALRADFSPAFNRDLKKGSKRHQWNLDELEEVVSLIIANTPDSLEELRRRHNMHSLKGAWRGSRECHVANAGDWLVVWADDGTTAYFQRTGTHDNIFGG